MKRTSLLVLLLLGLFGLVTQPAAANNATVRVLPYPLTVLADSKSIVSVRIEVRDRDGRFVPDGTEVTLNTTLGQFRDTSLRTSAGVARAVLVAGSVPGTAKITATVIGFSGLGEGEVQFVTDRKLVSAATDYIEVAGRDYLAYFTDLRWAAALGRNRGASVKYRDIEITADDLQLDASEERVVARRALLRIGKDTRECEQLSFRIRSREGIAVTEVDGRMQMVKLIGTVPDGRAEGERPETFMMRSDLDYSESFVTASRVTIFPGRKIQFHRASIHVGGTKVMSLPLYSMDMWGAGTQLFSTNLIGYNDGRLSLDVPFYYALSPRSTGALRLRTQQRGGRVYGASHGTFLDLEQSYSASDSYEGGFTVSDILSSRWGAAWHHNHRFSDSLQGNFLIDFPEHRGAYATASLSKQFTGYYAGINMSTQRQFQGFDPNTQRIDVYVETEPKKVRGTPFSNTIGITSNYQSVRTFDGRTATQSGTGIRWRGTMEPIRVTSNMNLRGGLSVSRLFGGNTDGFDITGTLASTIRLQRTTTASLIYDYSANRLSRNALGQHRLSSQFYSTFGPVQMSMLGTFGLDADYRTFYGDLSYRLGPLFRVGYGYTFQDYRGFLFKDYSLLFAYRLGFREIALTWSYQTNRIGFELLAAQF